MNTAEVIFGVSMCSGQRHRAQAIAQGLSPSSSPLSAVPAADPQQPVATASEPAPEPLEHSPSQPQLQSLATPLPSPCSQAAHQNVTTSAPQISPDSDNADIDAASQIANSTSVHSITRSTDGSMPRRGLRFDLTDDRLDSSTNDKPEADDFQRQRPLIRLPSASGLPPIHRAPSFKLQQQSQQQQLTVDGDEHDGSGDERALPEGITAIQVVDPDDPTSLVLQVCYLLCAVGFTGMLPVLCHLF